MESILEANTTLLTCNWIAIQWPFTCYLIHCSNCRIELLLSRGMGQKSISFEHTVKVTTQVELRRFLSVRSTAFPSPSADLKTNSTPWSMYTVHGPTWPTAHFGSSTLTLLLVVVNDKTVILRRRVSGRSRPHIHVCRCVQSTVCPCDRLCSSGRRQMNTLYHPP